MKIERRSRRKVLRRGDLVLFRADQHPCLGVFMYTRHDAIFHVEEYHFLTPRGMIYKYGSYIDCEDWCEIIRSNDQ